MKIYKQTLTILIGTTAMTFASSAVAQAPDALTLQVEKSVSKMVVSTEIKRDSLESLMAVAKPPSNVRREREKELPRPIPYTGVPKGNALDPVVQTTSQAALVGTPRPLAPAATIGRNFDGIGNGFNTFTVASAPPDTHGAVGSTQFVQMVNSAFAVFNKATGARVLGATAINSLFAGFGGKCETANDGDPIVNWDAPAQRWVITQFAVTPRAAPFLECVAVSKTADATGGYNRYAFSYTNFADYPKFAVWDNAYVFTFNLFNAAGTAFLGSQVCAYDRARMIAGLSATQQCFTTPNTVGSLLPSDPDGSGPVTAGTPNYLLTLNATSLGLYRFRANFTTPALTTFTGPTNIPVAAYTELCSATGTCVTQPGTANRLDALADRLMSRVSYRRYADGTERLLATHSIATGLRWYEIRNPGGAPTVFQQGTFAPTATTRWIGSMGQDRNGNIAIGYSASSSTTGVSPSLRFAVRGTTDPLGTLGVENVIIAGTGVQTGGLTRWGDYAAMTVDPVDNCTFWFTSEYMKTTGSFNWNTRVASFRLAGC